jgi:exodeoxyribonuclease VII large subunit
MKQSSLFGSEPQQPTPTNETKSNIPRATSTPDVAKPNVLAVPGLPPANKPAWREPLAEKIILSVSALTSALKDTLEPRFQKVCVTGEVTSFRGANASGHLYFSIKDANALIEVRVWQSTAKQLKFALKDGLSVVIDGAVSIYEPQGRYALVVQRIEPTGVGARALAFEQLKQKLLKEGLIGPNKKRPLHALPLLPRRIGIVTSLSGAALKDFLKVAHRRHPRLSVIVASTRVQGESAGYEIRRAIKALEQLDIDVLVVTRGGGSVDDLWTFNEEIVARSIFECRVPVVSAVGHEIDLTLADMACDVRAPTPSAAAELIVPVMAELELHLKQQTSLLTRAIQRKIAQQQGALATFHKQLGDPRRALVSKKLDLAQWRHQLNASAHLQVKEQRNALVQFKHALSAKDPRLQLATARKSFDIAKMKLRQLDRQLVIDHRVGLGTLNARLMQVPLRAQLSKQVALLQSQSNQMKAVALRHVAHQKSTLASSVAALDALSPLSVLSRGYAIVRMEPSGEIVRSSKQLSANDKVRLRFADAREVQAKITETE